jgi:hypothetical protein
MTDAELYDLLHAAVLAQIKASKAAMGQFSWFGRNHKKDIGSQQPVKKIA